MKRWGKHHRFWMPTSRPAFQKTRFDKLRRDILVDTAIVGGGITGLTAAYFLISAGKSVALLTDGEIGDGTTGSSTGHITEVLDEDLRAMVDDWGAEAAKDVVGSIREAINDIKRLSHETGGDSRFERVDGFKFTEDPNMVDRLAADTEIASELGINARLVKNVGLPFPVVAAMRVFEQAQIDPLNYAKGLAKFLESKGCQIFEETRALNIEDGKPCNVHTSSGDVTASEVILATHTPVGIYYSLHTRVAPYFSYVVAARLNTPPVRGLYWDMTNPYYYLRQAPQDQSIWLIGGRDHKTGQEEHTHERYLELEEYARERFDVAEIVSYWGDEYYKSVDGLPYIGKIPFTHSLFTGTGYSGTGLTFGTVAGRLMSDIILGRNNSWGHIYDPARVKPVASAPNFIRENVNVARQFVARRSVHHEIEDVSAIPSEEGRVVDIKGKKFAVYRDLTNHLHFFSPVCTHMGCTVQWNRAEKSWDCPCHGGRYKPSGEVFEGPPMHDLRAVDPESIIERPLVASSLLSRRQPLNPEIGPFGDEFSY